MSQHNPTAYGRSPPIRAASPAASAILRLLERAAAPKSPKRFQHSRTRRRRAASSRMARSAEWRLRPPRRLPQRREPRQPVTASSEIASARSITSKPSASCSSVMQSGGFVWIELLGVIV